MMHRLIAIIAIIAIIATSGCTASGDGEVTPSTTTPSLASISGLDGVTLLGPEESGTSRAPQFSWEPVDGATSYLLVVLNGDGQGLWSWRGQDSEVWMGGFGVELPAGLSEPVVTAGSTWTVTAYDGDNRPAAISARRSVSPESAAAPVTPPPTNSTQGTTPTTTATQTDIPPDPCRLIAPEDVMEFFDGDVPPPQVAETEFGTSCLIEQGLFGYLRVSVAPTSLTAASIGTCDTCVDVDLGDDAVGIEAPSGAVIAVILDGRLWTLDATGLGPVTIEQLVTLLVNVLSRL